MARWIIQDKEAGNFIDEFDSLVDAEIALTQYEEDDKRDGVFAEDFYEIVYDGVRYEDLSTTAKIMCMSNFLNRVIPYGWDDVNDGDIADLEDTIIYWLGGQFTIDEDGDWFCDGEII